MTFLRQWREYRNKTLEVLAAEMDISAAHLSRLENGLYPYNQNHLERAASALNCSPIDILSRNPADPVDQLAIELANLPPSARAQASRIIKALTEEADA